MASAPRAAENDGVELGVLGDLAGYHLRRASSAFGSHFAQAMAGTGMRQVLFGIISIVADNPGLNQDAAGRALGIQRANMVSLINELTDEGLIERTVSKEDRRAFSLNLSAKGSAKLAECHALIRVHEEKMLSDLCTADRAKLIELLARIQAKRR